MTIERLQVHYGFTLMPFGRALAPQMLHRHASHAELPPGSAGASANTPSAS